MTESSSEYDMFLDGLDDIPNMMQLVKHAPASPHRFRDFPNNSHAMDQAFKGHDEKERNTYANHSRNLVRQTFRAMDKVSTNNCPHRVKTRPSRPTHEVASVITEHLQDNQGGMLFKNLDPYQHGHITQEDFIQILSTKNTGLTRKEMLDMARTLDSGRSGLLDYSRMYSSLETLKSPQKVATTSGYSKTFEESKRGDNSCDNADSGSSYVRNFEESRSVKEDPALANSTTAPLSVPEPDQPYDGLQQYLNCQAKIETEKREVREKRASNERKYGDAFESVALLEKPSNNFAPHTSVKVKDEVDRYARGSGNAPYYSTPASMNDIVFNRFVVGRNGNKPAEVFRPDDVVGTVNYASVGDILGSSNGDDDASSYSRAYQTLRSATVSPRAQGEDDNRSERLPTSSGSVTSNSISASHKHFAPLPTSKVTGGADPHERHFIGNPNSARNRNSRAFHNSVIYDHRVPERLRKRERRSHSAPPGKRPFSGETAVQVEKDKSDGRLESVGSLLRYLSDDASNASASQSALPTTPVRVRSHTFDKSGEPERKRFADFACAPASPPKKEVVAEANTVKRSMNTLVTQLNDHSKIKILNHKMKRIDVSNSGYVNKSEFSTALKEMGVRITPEQVTTLYENHAKNNIDPDEARNSSLKLCTHQRGIHVQDFIQKMRSRTSSNMLAERRLRNDSSSSSTAAPVPGDEKYQTPLEREDNRVWKKVVEALSEDNTGAKRIITKFFKDAQLNHNNEVKAETLQSELNYIGAQVSDVEFQNMMSTVKRKPNGNVSVDDFAREYHKKSVECRDLDKWMALMPSLEATKITDSSLAAQGERFKRVLKTQKKHFAKKQGAESAKDDPNFRTSDFRDRLNDPVASATQSFEKGHVPACLTMSDAKEFRDERLKWSKLSNKFLNHKHTLLSAFGGEDGIDKPLTENAMKDKLFEAGVLLGNDDIKILQSYAITSTAKEEGDRGLTFGKMCSSMGLNLALDNRRRMTLSSSADFDSDTGVFGSASRSLLSNPNYQASMFTSSVNDSLLVKGNRKKRLDDATGLPQPGAPKQIDNVSEFWELKHVAEYKSLPAEKKSYHQRLNLPNDSYSATAPSINGSSGRGFTSLRQLTEERKRSSSAPPRYTSLSRNNAEEQATARAVMWESSTTRTHKQHQEQRGRSTAPIAETASRFAAAPLAEYIRMRQQQRQQDTSSAPMTTSDLQASYCSSAASEIDNR